MARKLPAKDVVVIGLGWTGSILSYELADAGLEVVAIESSPELAATPPPDGDGLACGPPVEAPRARDCGPTTATQVVWCSYFRVVQ